MPRAGALVTGGLTFSQIATQPSAASQPVGSDKSIHDIAFDGNTLIAGYGDWTLNTDSTGGSADRVGIEPLNLTTTIWQTKTPLVNGEALTKFRTIGGYLYAPNTDASSFGTGAFATNRSGSWQLSMPATLASSVHIFDIASRTDSDSDLWAAGSNNGSPAYAALWHSIDNGATWSIAQSDTDPGGWARYYWVAALNGSIYVQADHVTGGANLKKFDGTSWTNLSTTQTCYMGSNSNNNAEVEVFAGNIVCAGNQSTEQGKIRTFDGTTVTARTIPGASGLVNDIYVSGSNLYVSIGNRLYRTTDLTNWTLLGLTPANVVSMGVANDYVYLGMDDATIWRSQATITSSSPAVYAPPVVYGVYPADLTLGNGTVVVMVDCIGMPSDGVVRVGGIVTPKSYAFQLECDETRKYVSINVDTSLYGAGYADLTIANPDGQTVTRQNAIYFSDGTITPTITGFTRDESSATETVLKFTGENFLAPTPGLNSDGTAQFFLGLYNHLVSLNGQPLSFCTTQVEYDFYVLNSLDPQYFTVSGPCYRLADYDVNTDEITPRMSNTMFEVVVPKNYPVVSGSVQLLGGNAFGVYVLGISAVYNFADPPSQTPGTTLVSANLAETGSAMPPLLILGGLMIGLGLLGWRKTTL